MTTGPKEFKSEWSRPSMFDFDTLPSDESNNTDTDTDSDEDDAIKMMDSIVDYLRLDTNNEEHSNKKHVDDESNKNLTPVHSLWKNSIANRLHVFTNQFGRPPTSEETVQLLEGTLHLDDAEKDYEYQRENFYKLVEKGNAAIEGILELAKESEHPRTYEVAGNLIKQVSEVTEKLGDLQEKMKKLKEVPNSAPKNVTNALFVGSTAELQKMLKE